MKKENTLMRYITQKLRISTEIVHDPPIFVLAYCPGKAVRLKMIEHKNK